MTIILKAPIQASNHKRILIVDDEAAILFAYQKLIEREGIKVDVCENLETAMAHICDHAYFAVIADLRLAGTENTAGLNILQAIREYQPDAKVIMVTGYGNSEIEQMAFDLGAIHYFEKPVQPSVILDALKTLMSAFLFASSLPAGF